MIGIIIPLIQEASVFKIKKNATKRPIQISDNLLLFVSGVGMKNAANAIEQLAPKVSHLISWGTAAGLSSHLKAGDLLLPDLILDKNGIEYATDSNFKIQMVKLLPNNLVYESGSLCESENILKDANEKEVFVNKFNAIGCDMESATLAKLANQRGISFNALRVVSDDHTTQIPKSVYLSINEDGDFSIGNFFVQLIRKPRDLIQVIRLGKNFKKAKRTMLELKKALLKL